MMKIFGSTRLVLPVALALLSGCSDAEPSRSASSGAPAPDGPLFTLLPASETGVRFENRLEDTQELNVFTYRNYYNGGGVAIGDLSGDGLPDVVLTSNLGGPALYLNEGGFRFREATDEAGLVGRGFWATGVTMADVDGDGLLDVYVSFAGDVAGERRANELYLNRGPDAGGVPEFQESAEPLGIADRGYTTHAAFFDYDRDGDLDLYLVNNSFRPVSSFGMRNIRHVRDSLGGDKLFRNDGERFVDVSESAGVFGSEIGFGLGVGISDVNRDGWPDIYVSNDFFEQDYLYINNGDGTFAEAAQRDMPYISYFSMGLDIADINNDARPDVYVTDMLPEDERRIKLTTAFESWDIYQTKLANDYHHQFMRNMLHLNNGNGTFSDIGQMAGVARTDWSWSALIADFDLDGFKDIHVTNGLARDVTSQDYISFLADRATMVAGEGGRRVDFLELVGAMTSTPLPNYAFRNRGDLTFSDESRSWGLDTEGFSNGAAYGDLDGDGDLDLVVNNVNQEAFVYRNNARALTDNRFLQVHLEGEGRNRFAVGARVTLRDGARLMFQELSPSRGFQSSVDYTLTFGVGPADTIPTVEVEWPDGRVSTLRQVATNQRITVRQADAAGGPASPGPAASTTLFADVTEQIALDFVHRENEFVDFDRERLMPRFISTEGPLLAIGDVDGDGLTDAFVGGAKDQAGRLLLQRPDGRFVGRSDPFVDDAISEDLGAELFDADLDGDLDLYVVSGGSEFTDLAPALQDRLYLNDGRGVFRKAPDHLPTMSTSGSAIAVHDFDGDGDMDVFVGGRVVPWRYGLDPVSVLLANDGSGRFTDVTARVAPDLARVGMVTDAVWEDVDGDDRADLVVVGEWMPITVFRNTGAGRLERATPPGLQQSQGWWNRIVPADVNGDGRTDFVIGNLGLNTRLRASADKPVTMHVKDFDGNGFVEQILSAYNGDVSYPIAIRDDLIKTLPFLKARYLNFQDYALQTVSDIFTPEELADAVVKRAHTFASSVARNEGNGTFTLVPLPAEAQIAPVYAILVDDVDGDGDPDLLLAGNLDGVKPEYGRMGAGHGLVLENDGAGGFRPVEASRSGFVVPGQARDIARIPTPRGDIYFVTRNDDRALVFRGETGRP